jgi:hypothetical protein
MPGLALSLSLEMPEPFGDPEPPIPDDMIELESAAGQIELEDDTGSILLET